MPSAFLGDRGILRVSGIDSRAFLQGLFTCNMDKVSDERAQYGALLSPQGKILFDFLVIGVKGGEEPAQGIDGFLIDIPRDLCPDLTKRLSFYRLRAKVAIEDLSNSDQPARRLGVVATWGEEERLPPGEISFGDPRLPQLGYRSIQSEGEARSRSNTDAAGYEAHRIALGIAKGGVDFRFGETFPHEANFDRVNGVDFKKGCYVGQEVVSRVEHRGAARKRIVPVSFEGAAPPVGAEVKAADISLGIMGSSMLGRGLAMIRTDKAKEAAENGRPIEAAGVQLHLDRFD